MICKKDSAGIIKGICIIVLAAVVLPLLIMGFYDYPSFDDWSLGLWTHEAVMSGEGIAGVLKASVRTIFYWRDQGEARYGNVFLGSLQPGIWGERFYVITPWLMIGSLIFSECFLCLYLIGKAGGDKKWVSAFIIPSVAIQILCVPYPVETFYWYVGSINYTFIFGLSLVLLALFLKLSEDGVDRKRIILLEIGGIISAILVAGTNYSASLSFSCLFFCLSIKNLLDDRKRFWKTLPITVLTIGGLVVSAIAQGNFVRLEKEFGGVTRYTPVEAIFRSLSRTFINIISWSMDVKVFLMIVLIAPFMGFALKNARFRFPFPAIFTIFSFGIYASQITVNMYVEGGIAARRIADILFYGYHVWLIWNLGYWIGWILKKNYLQRFGKAGRWIRANALRYFLIAGGVLAVAFLVAPGGIRQTSTYRACVWLVRGDARAYGDAWESRISQLKDPEVQEVYFDPLPGQEELVFYADLQPGDAWINGAAARYYNKKKVGLKP